MGIDPFWFNKYITPCFSTVWKNCLRHTSTPSKKTPLFIALSLRRKVSRFPVWKRLMGFSLGPLKRPQKGAPFLLPQQKMVKPTRNQLRLKVDGPSFFGHEVDQTFNAPLLALAILVVFAVHRTHLHQRIQTAKLWYLWIKWKSYHSLP